MDQSVLFFLLLLSVSVASWTPQMRESVDKTLVCACVLKDPLVMVHRRKPLTTMAPLTTSTSDFGESLVVDEEDSENFVPYKYWNFYKRSTTQAKAQSESFMDRFLSIFHHEPSSTTPPMQDDPPLYAPFAKFGRRIMDQYYNNLRTKWNFLDRFQCSCTGNLVDIPRAKSFITMRVAYD